MSAILHEGGQFVTWNGKTFRVDSDHSDYQAMIAAGVTPARDLNAAAAQRLAALADRRWRATQRFTYDGVQTAADSAIAVVTAAIVSLQIAGPNAQAKPWKLGDGAWRVFDLADLIAFGQAIEAHVQACFNVEQQKAAAILAARDAGDAAALDAVDIDSGWLA